MKVIKSASVLLICLLWIFLTNYKIYPINSIGSLMTCKSGLLAISNQESNTLETNSEKDLIIKIDTIGIPYIYANENNDVAFGLGYMHAKDRYFQMELMAKMVKGELSEILGGRVFTSDDFWKPFEFSKKSKEIIEEYKSQDTNLYEYLSNYTAGINFYIEHNTINDPLYTIFNLKPQKWQVEDCLLVTWYMSRSLAYFDYHIEQQELIDNLPIEVLNLLYPQHPEKLKTILPSKKRAVEREINHQPLKKVAFENFDEASKHNFDIGSNNWVVNSQKATNSNPLIANDPHLFLTLPGAFYEACLMGNSIQSYGYTIPGVPLIISGHNNNISWGITNGEWDLTDRYLLETKADSLYLYQENWVPFEELEYVIEVRGKEKKKTKVKKTVHGIVKKDGEQYYAQKWYPASKSYSIKALYQVMFANNWYSFKKALEDYDYPPQNFIYADVHDTIGIVCAGKLPERPNNFMGGLLDGTKPALADNFVAKQWEVDNPEHNYIFSANQLPEKNEHYFGAHWHKDDYRVNRIDSLLKTKSDWDVNSFQKMQLDNIDISYFDVNRLLKYKKIHEKYNYIIYRISNWDGNMSNSDDASFIYETLRKSIEDEAQKFAKEKLKVRKAPSMKSFIHFLSIGDTNTHFENISKTEILNNIFERTDSLLNSDNYSTGQYKKSFIYNISFLPGLGQNISNLPGNKNTINMNASARPVFRSIYEMKKDNIVGYTIMAGGQSGKMNSMNYYDQLENWKDGKYKVTQFFSNPDDLKNIVNTLNFSDEYN